jgi:hypothetical protein
LCKVELKVRRRNPSTEAARILRDEAMRRDRSRRPTVVDVLLGFVSSLVLQIIARDM